MSFNNAPYSNCGPSHSIRVPQYPPVNMASNLPHVSYYANAVYYPNWKLSDEYADTEIEVDGTQGCINALTQLKGTYPELKVILSIGGGGQGSAPYARIASDSTLRQIFATNARALVDMYGFDGVDIDWEHPSSPVEGADYVSLLENTRIHLPEPFILTSALPAALWALRHINLRAATSYLSYLNLMGYDFVGPWSTLSGHHSQLFSPPVSPDSASVHNTITYVLSQDVPNSKILLGIPCFGRCFPGAVAPGQPYAPPTMIGTTTVDDRTIEYAHLPTEGCMEGVDVHVGGAWCVDEENGFVSYDNVRTVRLKAGYAKRMRLGGLFYWTGTGDVRGDRSLVEAGYNALHDL